jgi:hypothetical protein
VLLFRFYWSINLGSLISHTLVSYICQYGLPGAGGEDWGFFVGYSIPTCMMAVAIAVFLMGSSRYRKQPPKGSVLATAFSIVYEAIWTNSRKKGTRHVLDKAKKCSWCFDICFLRFISFSSLGFLFVLSR